MLAGHRLPALSDAGSAAGDRRAACHREAAQRAGRALSEDDPWTALRDFLAAAIKVLLPDPAVPPVFAAATDALERTGDLKRRLAAAFVELLARAHTAGVIDSGVTEADMIPLMCGIAYAANIPKSPRSDRTSRARPALP
ncbi:hypothetical protein ACFYVC_38520 [Streptomyces tendae]|uniref:SbtR family transcriptional regulator n=1 Tax=Streptomyces tendae TaxID=1932 RepID=UPI00369F1C29